MTQTKITFYPELCCEDCGEIIHNHMRCPSCNKSYASTDAYGSLGMSLFLTDNILTCEDCGAKFQLVKDEGYYDDWIWEYEENAHT